VSKALSIQVYQQTSEIVPEEWTQFYAVQPSSTVRNKPAAKTGVTARGR